MTFLDIGNITLTKGESSDKFIISSNDSLAEYKGKLRISDASGVKHEDDLKHTIEVKNNDNIYHDNCVIKYSAIKFDYDENVAEPDTNDAFDYKIEIKDVDKDELTETATVTGTIFTEEVEDTLTTPAPQQPQQDAGAQASSTTGTGGDAQTQGTGPDAAQGTTSTGSTGAVTTTPSPHTGGGLTLVSKTKKTPIKNAEVKVTLISTSKEVEKSGIGISNQDGEFTIKIPLGASVKIPNKQSIIFEISHEISEKLDEGRYYCVVTIFKQELDNSISFQKEIIQTKLEILGKK